ncbi:MAG TPA: ABC transporter substrate-binding protein [Bordetella sp.]
MGGQFSSRRRFIKTTGAAGLAAIAAPALWIPAARAASGQLVVADYGGAPQAAMRKAFYDPFEKATGIQVVSVAHDADPTTAFKVSVDSGSNVWDVCLMTPDHVARLSDPKNYLAPLNIADSDAKGILPGMLASNWFGFSVYSVLMAYRTDKYANGPAGWRDFWDTDKFPGRRGMFRYPGGTMENALLADGVAPKDLYPIDVDRALKSLSKIRKSVSVWWTNGAQNTQILQNGEVDMSDTWNSRVLTAIDAGAPVKMVWEGTYNVDGWAIPVSTSRADQARQFVRFCIQAERQAEYCNLIANGPSNNDAYKLIDPKRAELLPTYPKNFERLAKHDAAWWGKHYDAVNEKFQEWLLAA